MAAKYEFTPKGPILIEMFPKHDDFAVRTLGLPGMIGALGACFGRVVTLDSPKARPPGDFQWEATLWHELGHVITLQMSNQRVPRWLTEGISEYEERRAHREWARQMDFTFASLLNRGRDNQAEGSERRVPGSEADRHRLLPGVARGRSPRDHVRAERPEQAGARVRRAASTRTLRSRKCSTPTSISCRSASTSTPNGRLAPCRKCSSCPKDVQLAKAPIDELRKLANENPRSYPVQLAYGHALRKAGSTDEAMQVFERAAALAPSATGDDSPRAQMAEIALEKKDRTRAIAELTAFLNADFENVAAAHKLASLLQGSRRHGSGQAPSRVRAHRRARPVRRRSPRGARPDGDAAERRRVRRA